MERHPVELTKMDYLETKMDYLEILHSSKFNISYVTHFGGWLVTSLICLNVTT